MKNINIIFGAPGCGKTTYLINLLEELLQKNSPEKIAFVSFTRKGAQEGRDRAIKKFKFSKKEFPYFRTLHSIAFNELGLTEKDILSNNRHKNKFHNKLSYFEEFNEVTGYNLTGSKTTEHKFKSIDDEYLQAYALERNKTDIFQDFQNDFIKNFIPQKYQHLTRSFENYKIARSIRDFDDLILDFIKINKPLPVEYAIIDEAQDLTLLQWEFCKVAFRDCKALYIAGDDDQTIYEWSGANVDYFLSLREKAANIVILNNSYRLPREVLKVAKRVTRKIDKNNRVHKKLTTNKKGGQVFVYSSIEELKLNNEETYFFLARNNYLLQNYRSFLKELGLIFMYKAPQEHHKVYDSFIPSVSKKKYKYILEYENLRQNNPVKINQNVLLKEHLRKDLETWPVWYEAFNFDNHEINYLRKVFKNKTNIEDKVNCLVSTVHGVKGAEADNVVMLMQTTRKVWHQANVSSRGFDSEMRCLYVALTRAKKNLHLICQGSKFGYEKLIGNLLYK